jgi:methyl-accepting chemotaxis protein
MNDMADSAEQINMAVQHINEISVKNREGINNLIKEVSQFKLD